jgi:hypothetical protein
MGPAELSLATLSDPGKNTSLILKSSMNRPQGKSSGAKSRTGGYTHRNKNHVTAESDGPIGPMLFVSFADGWRNLSAYRRDYRPTRFDTTRSCHEV